MTAPTPPGRRELNKADKRRRIETAARALFAERGFSAVTTQEVATRAEVGTGTLFRYAQSKGELLCMVANEDFRTRRVPPEETTGPVDAICALAEPYLAALRRQPENALAYHRETLFGEPGPHREKALEILAQVRGEIAGILAEATALSPGTDEIRAGSRTVYDVLYMEIVRLGIPGAAVHGDSVDEHVRAHIARVVDGVLPTLLRSKD